jgi:outer membrane lipoprotein LolB
LALGGCASAPPVTEPSIEAIEALQAPFEAQGRLSARRGSDGVATNFVWEHDGERDRIDLSTPLGQTVAQLSGDPAQVEVELADHRRFAAADWDSLTTQALGLPIPVAGLAAWMRGLPHSGATSSIERDSAARPSVIRQDGWEIVYGYPDDATRRPSRLILRYPAHEPVEVRIAIDRWQ